MASKDVARAQSAAGNKHGDTCHYRGATADRIRQGPEEKLPPSEAEEQRSDDPLAFVVVSYPKVTPHFAQGGQHDVDG